MMVMVLALVVRRNWLENGSRLVVGNYWMNWKNVPPCLVPILCMSIQNLQREKYTWHFHLYSCTTMMTRTISMIRIVSKCYSIYPAIDFIQIYTTPFSPKANHSSSTTTINPKRRNAVMLPPKVQVQVVSKKQPIVSLNELI